MCGLDVRRSCFDFFWESECFSNTKRPKKTHAHARYDERQIKYLPVAPHTIGLLSFSAVRLKRHRQYRKTCKSFSWFVDTSGLEGLPHMGQHVRAAFDVESKLLTTDPERSSYFVTITTTTAARSKKKKSGVTEVWDVFTERNERNNHVQAYKE